MYFREKGCKRARMGNSPTVPANVICEIVSLSRERLVLIPQWIISSKDHPTDYADSNWCSQCAVHVKAWPAHRFYKPAYRLSTKKKNVLQREFQSRCCSHNDRWRRLLGSVHSHSVLLLISALKDSVVLKNSDSFRLGFAKIM